ncbi:MAG: hypothetical protein D3X82_01645 [Candidatus Leucobacter sulfamidivorax]|nr:hypothetical protein [Candidatus Leucobacter sulfamidivorax]
MRTTVDLPPKVHSRALELSKQRGQSLSATIAELASLGLARLGEATRIETDPISGLPVISVGRALTSEQVADFLDDE